MNLDTIDTKTKNKVAELWVLGNSAQEIARLVSLPDDVVEALLWHVADNGEFIDEGDDA